MRRRAGAVVTLAVAVVVLAFFAMPGCNPPTGNVLPPPSSTSSTGPTTSTTEVDGSTIALERVPGETTTTAPLARGDTTIRGVVVGPGGGVVSAVVRLERLVGDAVQRSEVVTDDNGGFIAAEVPGGRYRIRAFQSPSLTMAEPEILFVPDGEDRELRLEVEPFEGRTVQASVNPDAPVVGDGVNLAVRVTERRIDDDGIGREAPVPDLRVEIDVTGWELLDDEPVARTDGDGTVLFRFRCERAGPATATARVGGAGPSAGSTSTTTTAGGSDDGGAGSPPVESVTLEVPGCGPRPTTTTTRDDEDDGDDDGNGAGTTSTTRG